MAQDSQTSNNVGWLEASGLLHIFRLSGLAVHPAKLGIGLAAIILTFMLGIALDAVWVGHGTTDTAVSEFIRARELDQPYEEAKGDRGIFAVWREHELRSVLGLLGSSLPGASLAAGTPVGTYVQAYSHAGPLRNLAGMVYGVWWLSCFHTVYFILFALGALLIWSCAGGAICRIAAVQFASDEKLTMMQGLRYARDKLFDGFFLAPCIPLVFIGITMVLLAMGGLVLRVPVFGDLIAGLSFGLAIVGGFVISILLLGLLVGGSLFWPAVAVEGADAFDSFSRGLSYPLSKPWKAVLYAVVALVYASICWVFVNLFTFLMLTITRSVVAFGTSPFGWWSREVDGAKISKLELLWPLSGPNALYSSPEWGQLASWEYISAFFIGVSVLIVIGLMWSFLASLYFSGSTIIYYLLRRDVDGTDLEDIYVEEENEDKEESSAGVAAAPQMSSSVTTPSGNTSVQSDEASTTEPQASSANEADTPGVSDETDREP